MKRTADKGHIPSLDGMRAMGIALVMGGHFTGWQIWPDGLGVSTFFVVSGFIVSLLLMREFDRKGRIDFASFYWRKVYRLLPLMVLSVAVAGLLQATILQHHDWFTWPRAVASLLFYQNYASIDPVFKGPLAHHWSQAIFLHFYLIIPASLTFFASRGYSGIVRALLVVCVFSLTCRVVVYNVIETPLAIEYIYRATETRIDAFAIGALLAVIAHWHAGSPIAGLICRPLAAWIGLALLVGVLFIPDMAFKQTIRPTIQCLSIALMIAGLCLSEGSRSFAVALANWRPVVILGQISFAAYVLHLSAYETAKVFLGDPPLWVMLPIGTAFAILVAWLVHVWIEKPVIAFGKRWATTSDHARQEPAAI
jgi:peptidoglycan/LPS O-acetylase OafA/YrhL